MSTILDGQMPTDSESILIPLGDSLFVPLAWALDVLAEHPNLCPATGQLWRLTGFDAAGVQRVFPAQIEMVQQEFLVASSRLVLHVLDTDSSERFALLLPAFLAMKPQKVAPTSEQ